MARMSNTNYNLVNLFDVDCHLDMDMTAKNDERSESGGIFTSQDAHNGCLSLFAGQGNFATKFRAKLGAASTYSGRYRQAMAMAAGVDIPPTSVVTKTKRPVFGFVEPQLPVLNMDDDGGSGDESALALQNRLDSAERRGTVLVVSDTRGATELVAEFPAADAGEVLEIRSRLPEGLTFVAAKAMIESIMMQHSSQLAPEFAVDMAVWPQLSVCSPQMPLRTKMLDDASRCGGDGWVDGGLSSDSEWDALSMGSRDWSVIDEGECNDTEWEEIREESKEGNARPLTQTFAEVLKAGSGKSAAAWGPEPSMASMAKRAWGATVATRSRPRRYREDKSNPIDVAMLDEAVYEASDVSWTSNGISIVDSKTGVTNFADAGGVESHKARQNKGGTRKLGAREAYRRDKRIAEVAAQRAGREKPLPDCFSVWVRKKKARR